MRHKRRGSVLALVLALIILMAFIAVAFLEEAKEKIRYDALFHRQEDIRAEAYSALDATLAVLHVFREVDGALWGPRQGWSDPLDFAQFEPSENLQVAVSFHDESGRFSLENADFDLLRRVFDHLGFNQAEAEELTDSLLDWIDEDDLRRLNGFDGEDYRRLNPPYEPANRMLRSWDELALIPAFQEYFWDNGVLRPEYRTFTSAFSLRHSGPVNVNSANDFVLEILDDMGVISRQNLQEYLAGPDRKPGTEDDRVLRSREEGGVFRSPDADALADVDSELLEVRVEVGRGDARFLLSAQVSWRGANAAAAAGGSTPANSTRRARSSGEQDEQRRSRGSAATRAGNAAQLDYPFQIHWLSENRKN